MAPAAQKKLMTINTIVGALGFPFPGFAFAHARNQRLAIGNFRPIGKLILRIIDAKIHGVTKTQFPDSRPESALMLNRRSISPWSIHDGPAGTSYPGPTTSLSVDNENSAHSQKRGSGTVYVGSWRRPTRCPRNLSPLNEHGEVRIPRNANVDNVR